MEINFIQRTTYANRDYSSWLKAAAEICKVANERAGNIDAYTGAVQAKMSFFHKMPANFTKAKKNMVRTGELRPITKPDIDNVEKAVHDAAKGIVFKDDNQIVWVEKHKLYAYHDDDIRVEVEYSPWPR